MAHAKVDFNTSSTYLTQPSKYFGYKTITRFKLGIQKKLQTNLRDPSTPMPSRLLQSPAILSSRPSCQLVQFTHRFALTLICFRQYLHLCVCLMIGS